MSITCKNCGTQVNDGVKFCTGCGKPVSTEGTNDVAISSGDYNFSTGAKGFVDTGESGAYSLKNGLLMNYISGEGFIIEDAVITNKRLYYSASSGLINKHYKEEIVDVADITGSKIAHFKPWALIILVIISGLFGIYQGVAVGNNTVMMIACCAIPVVFLALFFITSKSYLRVEYAGGHIGFSVKKYGLKNVRAFQRQIYVEKEKIRKENYNRR